MFAQPSSACALNDGGTSSMTTSRPALLSFRDVVVTPYTDLLERQLGKSVHRGGPRWPNWSSQTAARHCRRGVPVDDEPLEAEPVATLPGPLAWGGAITPHFGHQIADFSTRLLPTLAEIPDARFAFSTWYVRENDKASPVLRAVLEWYGIREERVDLITEPTLVERLAVALQAEQALGPGPEPWYLDLLDEHARSRLGRIEKSGSLYVSRAGQAGRLAGEEYLERALQEAGFRALRPETVSLEEQLRAYAGAESIVFAEGSAIHGTQLLGRALGDVRILLRRGWWQGWTATEPLLQPRSRSLRYVDAMRGLVHGLNLAGERALVTGLSILDPERLLEEFPSLGDVWDHEAFEAARDADVVEWLETERASPRWEVPGSAELVAEKLRAAGLAHLSLQPITFQPPGR
jgi:Glycosyltransferase 61